jgi:hypothetical protein
MKEKFLRRPIFFTTFLLSLVLTLIHYPHFIHDTILKRDDIDLIVPMSKVTGIGDYIDMVSSNQILDVQPLRDLSFLCNTLLADKFNLPTFHLTNLFLFLLAIYLLGKILDVLKFNKSYIFAGMILFALHPVMVAAVGWISARKHILGLVFILYSLYDYLKNKNVTLKGSLGYLGAILSHQIFILFPVWVFADSLIGKRTLRKSIFGLYATVGFIVLTMAYYKSFYLQMANVSYTTFSLAENISRFVLSMGRAVSLMIVPAVLSGAYYQGSIWNLVGLPLMVLILFLCYKNPKRKETLSFALLAALTLLPSYIAFIHDTYLYLPLVCFLIIASYLLSTFETKIPKSVLFASFSLVTLLFFVQSFRTSLMWVSDKDLWANSYAHEGSPFSAIMLGAQLFPVDQNLALDLMHDGAKEFDLRSNKQAMEYFLKSIYVANVPVSKKIKILKDCQVRNDVYEGYLGLVLLEGDQTQEKEGLQILQRLLQPGVVYSENTEGSRISAAIKNLCQENDQKKYICDTLKVIY